LLPKPGGHLPLSDLHLSNRGWNWQSSSGTPPFFGFSSLGPHPGGDGKTSGQIGFSSLGGAGV